MLVILAVVLVALVSVVTPWRALPAGAERVPVDVSRDFTPAEVASGSDFRSQMRVPALLGTAVSLLTVLVLGLTPIGAAVVTWANRPGGPWPLRVALGAVALALLLRLVTLPTAAWSRSISRRNGLSTQSWADWAADVLRAWLVTTAMLVVALVVLVGLARRLPDRLVDPGVGARGADAWWSRRSSTRWWSSRCSTSSPRCRSHPCAPSLLELAERGRASRSTTSSSPTPAGAPPR